MTHQEIIDRIEGVTREQAKAWKVVSDRARKEVESLQELCGGLGHIFALSRHGVFDTCEGRRCVFCGAYGPHAEPQEAVGQIAGYRVIRA